MLRKTKDSKKEKENKATKSKVATSDKKELKKDVKDEKAKKEKTSKITKKAVAEKKAKSTSETKTTKAKKNTVAKKVATKTATKKVEPKKEAIPVTPEYYDLPYRYDETVIKLLAQTPNNLFIYWDISDKDREKLKQTYGEHFFEVTRPVLIVHNDTLNYSFEVAINDFANSWYIHINDSKCDYRIELGRRPIPINYTKFQNSTNTDIVEIAENTVKQEPPRPVDLPYVFITSSNEIQAPNDKILFNKYQKQVNFRNVKTGEVVSKDIKDFLLISNIGNFDNIYSLYKEFYKNEEILKDNFVINNPGSGATSSGSLPSSYSK